MFHTTVGGVVTSATKELNDALHFTQNMHGNIMTPDTAFKTLQTCKTMAVRIHESISVSACLTVYSYVSTSFPSLTSQSLCLSIALIFSPHVLHMQHTYIQMYVI